MDENAEEEKKEKSLKRVFSRFSEKTTMHAAPYINSATFTGAKVIWSILLVAGIAVMSLHLYFLIDNFVSWPKKTTLSLGFSNLELPAVTICNVNPVRLSKLNDTSEILQQLVGKVDPVRYDYGRRRKRFVDSFDNQNLSYYNDKDDFDYLEEEMEEEDEREAGEFTGPKDTLVTMLDQFTELFMEEDIDIRREVGHDINTMLLRCSFGRFSCYPENFTLFQTQQYGNCYTVESKKMMVKEPGPANGLTLMLYMENYEYLPGITDGYGARVHIHPKNTIPFPYESGFYVQTGHETIIALKQIRIDRISEPHGTCRSNEEFFRLYGKVYNRQSCQYLCRPTLNTQKCHCYDDYDYDLFRNSSIRPCTTKADFECIYRVELDIRKKTLTCDCPDPCVDTDYTMNIASRQWPTDQYSRLLKASVCEEFPDDCDRIKGYGQETLGKNFLKVVIYYQQLNYQLIKEDPDIENSQFASDVGGAIGLWIGLSILSIFEIFQLIVEIIAYFMHRNKREEDKRRERRQQRRDDDRRDYPKRPEYHDSDSDFPKRPVYHVTDSYGYSDRYKPRSQLDTPPQDYQELHVYRGKGSAYSGSAYEEPVYKPRYTSPL